MKILFSFVALCLASGPQIAFAQPAKPPVAAKQTGKLPNARELLDHLYAPYEAARTFRGQFDILIKGNDPTNTMSEIHLKTAFRFDDKGDLAGYNTTSEFVSRADPTQRQTLHSVDDGRAANLAFVEQKSWCPVNQRDTSPLLTSLLKPMLEGIVQPLGKIPGFVPIVSRSVEAGRAVFVLTAKNSDFLRVVVDAHTRALRSFDVAGTNGGGVSIHGSNQSFDEPIENEEFVWTPPAEFKRVEIGDITLPAFLGATFQNRPVKTAPIP